MKIFVIAGIGTGVGKTLTSAVLVEALGADYWKPVQSGNLTDSDTMTVKDLVSNDKSVFHPEAYSLAAPLSPHIAAEMEDKEIRLDLLKLPATGNSLVVELAGGLMSPLNRRQLNLDAVIMWKQPVILVSQHYLGSINHTLLSINALKQAGANIHGIIFNGDKNPATEEMILGYSNLKRLGHIPQLAAMNKNVVRTLAKEFETV
jgi:dethiobiotin synthetase